MLNTSDLWQQEEFEDHVAAMLVSLFETRISGRARNCRNKPARLTESHLIRARVIGPYIPGKDRRVWPNHFDLANDQLPSSACVSLAGETAEHYRHTALVERVRELPPGVGRLDSPFFRVNYFMFRHKGPVEGFTAYFAVDPSGRIHMAPMDNYTWREEDSEAITVVAQVLQAEADRRFCWQIEAKEKIAHAFLGCQSEQVKSLLYARSLPLTVLGRKRPILHLVEAHRRRLRNGTDIDIADFLRGISEVEMGGTLFRVHAPENMGLSVPGERQTDVGLRSALKRSSSHE